MILSILGSQVLFLVVFYLLFWFWTNFRTVCSAFLCSRFLWFVPLPTIYSLWLFILRQGCSTAKEIERLCAPEIFDAGQSERWSYSNTALKCRDVPSNPDATAILCLQVSHWYVWFWVWKGHWSTISFRSSPLSVSMFVSQEVRWIKHHILSILPWKARSNCPAFFYSFYTVCVVHACEGFHWRVVSLAFTLVIVSCTTSLVNYIAPIRSGSASRFFLFITIYFVGHFGAMYAKKKSGWALFICHKLVSAFKHWCLYFESF